jgi:hypothetical protein
MLDQHYSIKTGIYSSGNLKILDNYLCGVGFEFVDFQLKDKSVIILGHIFCIPNIKMKGFNQMVGRVSGTLQSHFSVKVADYDGGYHP